MDPQFNNQPPILPLPVQSSDTTSMPEQTGQTSGTSGTQAPSGAKSVGGSTSGVNASKGASTAVGVNSLIVDQNAQSTAPSSAFSGMGMDAASLLGEAPMPIDPQSMFDSLGNVATDLDKINAVMNSFVSDVSQLAGSGSVKGKVKGDQRSQGPSPTAESTVSKSVSPTGDVTTTVSTSTVNSSGSVTTNTATTTTSDDATTNTSNTTDNNSSSTGSTSSTTGGPASPDDTISMTDIMNMIGSLEAQESETLAQQQTSQIDAMELQYNDTMNQASKMLTGANQMLEWAVIGVGVSMGATAYGMGGIGTASREGNQAEMESMEEQQAAMERSMTSASNRTAEAVKTPNAENISKANDSINQTKALAKEQQSKGIITKDQQESINQQSHAQLAAVHHAQYQPGGVENASGKSTDSAPSTWNQPKNTDGTSPLKNESGNEITTPTEAAQHYQAQANSIGAARPKNISYSQLSKQGITPGQNVSEAQAKAYIKATRTPKDNANVNAKQGTTEKATATAKDPNTTNAQETQDNAEAKAFQEHVKSLKLNRNTQAWQGAYNSRFQRIQIYTSAINSLSMLFSQGMANMENETYQAYATEAGAAAQVEGSTESAMSQGVSQTEQVVQELRSNQSAVAQDMQTMVSSTKV